MLGLVAEEAVEEAKASPEPALEDLWTDICYKGTVAACDEGKGEERGA